jgi:hypothetical protein
VKTSLKPMKSFFAGDIGNTDTRKTLAEVEMFRARREKAAQDNYVLKAAFEDTMKNLASTTLHTVINANIEEVFSLTLPIDLTVIFKRYLLIPAVVKTVPPAGNRWNRAGLERKVFLADGNTAREILTDVEPPNFFSYKVFDVSNFIGNFAEYAIGEWHFEKLNSSTIVSWTYSFKAKNNIAWYPLFFIVRTFFRGYMKQALFSLKNYIEEKVEQKVS